MSTVSISYKDLKNASSEANSVAKKFDSYANSLESKVYNKLKNYDGQWTSGLSNAYNKIGIKISDLRDQHDKYTKFSGDLSGLKEKCDDVDKSVKSKVSSLTASFKDAYGIKSNVVVNQINYFFTWIGNETAFGRWLGDKKDAVVAKKDYLKQCISEWYNYEGGKEALLGCLTGLSEIFAAVATVVYTISTGGALLTIIAGVVAGVIAISNGVANIINENKAYVATLKGDPATGRRRSEINKWQDYLRSSFAFGDSGENYEYNKFYNDLAVGIDVTVIVCTVITAANSAGKFLKNTYKWATGDIAKVKDITMKQVFSKDSFAAFKTKSYNIWTSFKKNKGLFIKNFCVSRYQDFGKNIKSEYFDFHKSNGKSNLKGSIKSIKNMLSIPKDITKDLSTGEFNLFELGVDKVLLPGLTVFSVKSTENIPVIDNQINFKPKSKIDKVTVSDIKGLFEKGGKIGKSTIKLIDDGSKINKDVLDKLNLSCDINISIPDVNIPNVDLPVLRAA